jgi:hypothetical protein
MNANILIKIKFGENGIYTLYIQTFKHVTAKVFFNIHNIVPIQFDQNVYVNFVQLHLHLNIYLHYIPKMDECQSSPVLLLNLFVLLKCSSEFLIQPLAFCIFNIQQKSSNSRMIKNSKFDSNDIINHNTVTTQLS